MYKWYADDSALKKAQGDLNRPVLLFGGILISREDEVSLSNMMKRIKSEYTGESMPVKFNMKDLRNVYSRFERQDEYELLLKESFVWRKTLIEESLNYDYKIVISCIENFNPNKNKQKEIKMNLSSYMFSNSLMRVGLLSKDLQCDHVQVILDWPESNQSKPFDREYWYAYNRGTSSEGQEYFCNALKDIGFDQTLYYARCNHSNLLQLTDIILGSTRDWLETDLQGRTNSIGKELAQLFMPKFYQPFNKILGYGINVSSSSANFKSKLSKIVV